MLISSQKGCFFLRIWDTSLFCPYVVSFGSVMVWRGVSFSMEMYYNDNIMWLEITWRWVSISWFWLVLAGLFPTPVHWFSASARLLVVGLEALSLSHLKRTVEIFWMVSLCARTESEGLSQTLSA